MAPGSKKSTKSIQPVPVEERQLSTGAGTQVQRDTKRIGLVQKSSDGCENSISEAAKQQKVSNRSDVIDPRIHFTHCMTTSSKGQIKDTVYPC